MSEQLKEYISVNSNNLITSFVWSGLLDRAKCGELLEIIKMCSVKAVPIEVLQEIRQEIQANIEDITGHYSNTPFKDMPSSKIYRNEGRQECIEIIDKHIKEYTNETDN